MITFMGLQLLFLTILSLLRMMNDPPRPPWTLRPLPTQVSMVCGLSYHILALAAYWCIGIPKKSFFLFVQEKKNFVLLIIFYIPIHV